MDFFTKKRIDKLTDEEVVVEIKKIKEEIAQIEKDLSSFDAQKEDIKSTNQTHIDELRAYLEDDKDIYKDEISKLKEEIVIYSKKLDKLNKEYSEEINKHNKDKEAIKNRIVNEVSLINKQNNQELKELKKQYEQKNQNLQIDYDEYEKNIIDKNKNILNELNENKKRLDKEFIKIQENVKYEQGQMIDNYNRLIEQEASKKDKLVSKSNKIRESQKEKEIAINDKLANLIKEKKEDILDKTTNWDKDYIKMKQEFDTQLENQKAELLELTKRKNELEASYSQALSIFNKEKDSLLSQYEKEKSAIDFENQKLVQDEKLASDELANLKASLAKKENELQAFKVNAQKELGELNSTLEVRKNEAIAKHEALRMSEESTLSQALEEMTQRYQEMKNALLVDKEKEVSRYNADYRMNQRRYLTKTKDIRSHYDALKAEYEEKLNSIRKANLVLQDEIDADLHKHEIKMMSLNQKIADENMNWQRTLSKQKEEYDTKVENLIQASNEHRINFEKEKEELVSVNEALNKEKELKDLFYAKEISRLEGQLASIAETKTMRAANHESLLNSITAEINDTKAKIVEVTGLLDEEAQNLTAKKEEARNNLDKKLAELEVAHQNKLIEINNQYEKERLNIEKSLDEKKSARDLALDELDKMHLERLSLKEDEFKNEQVALESQKQAIFNKYQEDLNALLKENEDKTANLNKLKAQYEAEVKEKENELDNLVNDYKAKIEALKEEFKKNSDSIKTNEENSRNGFNNELETLNKTIEDNRLSIITTQSDFEAKIRSIKEAIESANHEKDALDSEYNLKVINKSNEKDIIFKELQEAYDKVKELSLKNEDEYNIYINNLNEELTNLKLAFDKEEKEVLKANNDKKEVALSEAKKIEDGYTNDLANKEENLNIEFKAKESKIAKQIDEIVNSNETIRKDYEQKLLEHKRLNDDLDKQYEALNNRLISILNEFKENYHLKKNELDSDYLNTRRKYQDELADLQKSSSDRLKDLINHNDKMRFEIEKLDEAHRAAIDGYNDELASLNNELELAKLAIEKAKVAYSNELDDCEHLINALRADYQNKINNTYQKIESLNMRKKDYEDNHKRLLKKVKVEHDLNIEKAKQELDSKLNEYQNNQEKLIAEVYKQENVIKEAYQNKIKELMEGFNQRQIELEEKHLKTKEEYLKLISLEENRIANRQADIESIDNQINKSLAIAQNDMQKLNDEHAQKILELENSHKEKINNLKNESEKYLNDIYLERENLSNKVKEINEAILNTKMSYNESKANYLKESQKMQDEYLKVLDNYQSEVETKSNKHSFFKH